MSLLAQVPVVQEESTDIMNQAAPSGAEVGTDAGIDTGETDTSFQVKPDSAETPEELADNPDKPEIPEWLQSKYQTDDRSVEESIAEQAKAYTELSSKFGGFAGAPEEYAAFEISEELTAAMAEKGIDLLADDNPLMAGMKGVAKDLNMSQEGLNKFAETFIANQMESENLRVQNELSELGPNANARINEVQQWAKGLPADIAPLLEAVATSAKGIEFIEFVMSKNNEAQIPSKANQESTGVNSKQELDRMVADPRYRTDASYRAQVEAKANKMFAK